MLVIGKLAFQLIHFQLSGFCAGFVFILAVNGFRDHLVLFFKTDLQFFEIRLVAFNFFLLTQRGLHQIQVIARGLVISFQIAFRTVVLTQFTRHIHVFVLLCRQLLARGIQFTTIFQCFIQMDTAFVGVAHIIRGHIVGRFAD